MILIEGILSHSLVFLDSTAASPASPASPDPRRSPSLNASTFELPENPQYQRALSLRRSDPTMETTLSKGPIPPHALSHTLFPLVVISPFIFITLPSLFEHTCVTLASILTF